MELIVLTFCGIFERPAACRVRLVGAAGKVAGCGWGLDCSPLGGLGWSSGTHRCGVCVRAAFTASETTIHEPCRTHKCVRVLNCTGVASTLVQQIDPCVASESATIVCMLICRCLTFTWCNRLLLQTPHLRPHGGYSGASRGTPDSTPPLQPPPTALVYASVTVSERKHTHFVCRYRYVYVCAGGERKHPHGSADRFFLLFPFMRTCAGLQVTSVAARLLLQTSCLRPRARCSGLAWHPFLHHHFACLRTYSPRLLLSYSLGQQTNDQVAVQF
jgi:hypothetical protein